MHGLKRRGLETEHQPPRQSPTLLRSCCSIEHVERGFECGHSAGWFGAGARIEAGPPVQHGVVEITAHSWRPCAAVVRPPAG
jgi:hypothetical protein